VTFLSAVRRTVQEASRTQLTGILENIGHRDGAQRRFRPTDRGSRRAYGLGAIADRGGRAADARPHRRRGGAGDLDCPLRAGEPIFAAYPWRWGDRKSV